MKNSRVFLLMVLFLLVSFAGIGPADTESLQQKTLSKIVFLVHWYDVGKAALEGLPGVHNVAKGFRGFREINTVIYDPTIISLEQMITKLQASGTYIGVAKEQ